MKKLGILLVIQGALLLAVATGAGRQATGIAQQVAAAFERIAQATDYLGTTAIDQHQSGPTDPIYVSRSFSDLAASFGALGRLNMALQITCFVAGLLLLAEGFWLWRQAPPAHRPARVATGTGPVGRADQ